MKKQILAGIVIAALAAPAAWATIGDVAPANPCPVPNNGNFKGKGLAILDVTGDGSVGAGCLNGVWAETVITCTSKEKQKGNPPVAVNMDVAIEYYDSGGNLISGGLVVGINAWCGAVPGDTFTFYTDPWGGAGGLAPPWAGVGEFPGLIATNPVAPGVAGCAPGTPGCFNHGSARVLSTSTKIQCSATRVDLSSVCTGWAPVPQASKNLTIIKSPAQKGD